MLFPTQTGLVSIVAPLAVAVTVLMVTAILYIVWMAANDDRHRAGELEAKREDG